MPHYPKRTERPVTSRTELLKRSAIDDPAVWVQLLRASRGLTQEQLAELAEMHPSQISAYETGMKSPRPATRAKLAAAVGSTPEAVTEAARFFERRPSRGPGAPSARAVALGEWVRRQVEAELNEVTVRLQLSSGRLPPGAGCTETSANASR
ncbi:MAG: helix-turn-helix transcriptional regulator [Acidobacteriota bacterium]